MVYKNIKYAISVFLMLITSVVMAQEIVVHDPVVIKQKDTYYLFCTGNGISVYSSKDLKKWDKQPQVFKEKPVWADGVAADFKNHIWLCRKRIIVFEFSLKRFDFFCCKIFYACNMNFLSVFF